MKNHWLEKNEAKNVGVDLCDDGSRSWSSMTIEVSAAGIDIYQDGASINMSQGDYLTLEEMKCIHEQCCSESFVLRGDHTFKGDVTIVGNLNIEGCLTLESPDYISQETLDVEFETTTECDVKIEVDCMSAEEIFENFLAGHQQMPLEEQKKLKIIANNPNVTGVEIV